MSEQRCPHCETPYEGERPDDCCSGAEAAFLRGEVERLTRELDEVTTESCKLGMAGGLMQGERDDALEELTLLRTRQEINHGLLDRLGAPKDCGGIPLNINGRLEDWLDQQERIGQRGGDLVSLRQAGDLMQSCLSRIAEFINSNINRDAIPYEVRMALLEASDSIDAWTRARTDR